MKFSPDRLSSSHYKEDGNTGNKYARLNSNEGKINYPEAEPRGIRPRGLNRDIALPSAFKSAVAAAVFSLFQAAGAGASEHVEFKSSDGFQNSKYEYANQQEITQERLEKQRLFLLKTGITKTPPASVEQINELLKKDGRKLWLLLYLGKINESDLSVLTPDQLFLTFKEKGGALWASVGKGRISMSFLDQFSTNQLSESLKTGGYEFWDAFADEKLPQEFLYRFTTEQLSQSLIKGGYMFWFLVGLNKIPMEFVDRFTSEQLAKSFISGGKAFWKGISNGELPEEILQRFIPEQLAQSFKKGGREFWDFLYSKPNKKLLENFTPEQLAFSFKEGGKEFWAYVIKNEDKNILKDFNADQLALSLESAGFVFWVAVDKGLFPKERLSEFTLQQLALTAKNVRPASVDIYLDYMLKSINRGTEAYNSILNTIVHSNPLSAARYIEKNSSTPEAKNMLNSFEKSIPQIVQKLVEDEEYNILMRIINSFHHRQHDHLRAKIIQMLDPFQRARLASAGRQELFTSTSTFVNHLYPAILQDIGNMGGVDEYLSKLADTSPQLAWHVIFILSRYDRLKDVLEKHPIKEPQTINMLLNGILDNSIDSDAILAINALAKVTSISDILQTIESKLQSTQGATQAKLEIIRDILIGDFVLPDYIPQEKLFAQEGENIKTHTMVQIFLEGGDKDGIASRWNAIEKLKQAGFSIKHIDGGEKGVNDDVIVLAKQINSRRVEVILSPIISNEAISLPTNFLKLLEGKNIHSFAYRGHSTFVPDIIRLLNTLKASKKFSDWDKNLQILYLGSCGGASSISEVLKSFNNKNLAIFATSGTGSTSINDPVLVGLTETLLQEGEFRSKEFWEKQKAKLGKIPKFKDYKPPHQNLSAVIAARLAEIEKW